MKEEVPISCSWQDPDEEDIEKLCFDSELDEQDPNEAGPICVPKIAAKNEPNDAMSCSEKDSDEVDSQSQDSDEVDSQRLPNLDSEADAMGCLEKDSDEVDSERLPDLDSEAEVCATQNQNELHMSSQNLDQNILNDKNELHMSSQNYTQHTQTLRAKYLKTDQMDEKGRVYCGGCGYRDYRSHMT